MSLRSISRMMVALLLLCVSLPLQAQVTSTDNTVVEPSTQPAAGAPNAPAAGGETKPAKVEVFLGYSWMTLDNSIHGTKGGVPVTLKLQDAKGGFNIDVSYFFNKYAGLTLNTGAHFGDNYDASEVFVGPTVRFPAEHIQPFVHFLAGWSRLAPGNFQLNDSFGAAVGGGLDVHISRHVNVRLLEADYRFGAHDFGPGNPQTVSGTRLSSGFVFLGGIEPETVPTASCNASPAEVFAGEPVTLKANTQGFDPKHTLKYEWATNGGKVKGEGDTVSVDTTGVAEGQSYSASVHISDSKNKKAVANCQAAFATKKRLPPTTTCSVNPTTVIVGTAAAVHADASSPQGGPVTVTIKSDTGNFSGQGNDLNVNTTGLNPGTVNFTCTVTDDHQLTATANTALTVQPKPEPPKPPKPPTLALRSVYFATAQPTPKNPNAGLVKSQQDTLTEIANEFKRYLAVRPEAKLTLEAHADPRGSESYNQALTERRAARVSAFLQEHGIPAANLENRPLGKQQQLTPDEVKRSMEADPSLTPNEKKRILRNMKTMVLASNRRVDLKLNVPGEQEQESVREFPFSAADALSLIGGREAPKPPKAVTPKRTKKGAAGAAKKGGATKKGGAAKKKKK